MSSRTPLFVLLSAVALAGLAALASTAYPRLMPVGGSTTVPNEIMEPGTQPTEGPNLGPTTQCQVCHGNYDADTEPFHQWQGSMMSHASRDPMFWAAMTVADQNVSGSGDLCLRCHTPRGWLAGRSTPTDGSGLAASDTDGVECALCHKLVNPDDSEHLGVQNPPFEANDANGGYYGSGMMVLWPGGERLGPYANPATPHGFLQSNYHRSPNLCGTCHDVSNPLVGDLAHNNGAQIPLQPGTFSDTLGSPVAGKAAFNNAPHAYGVVERTFSEHQSSALSTTPVSAYATLPDDIRDGAIEYAYERAVAGGGNGDYEDGTVRNFSCQSCHLAPTTGRGCNFGSPPTRTDLPQHDLTGGNYWVPDVLAYMDNLGQLPFGGGLPATALVALSDGKARAMASLERAARLDVSGDVVRVTNLTGHKLITGYPEGRRMWLNVKWYDGAGTLVREDGEYGTLNVTLNATPHAVETILDPNDPDTRIYQIRNGITQEWAAELISVVGVPPTVVVEYDHVTGAPVITLGQLAAMAPGTAHHSQHFILNNTILSDNRIPPYRMDHDAARTRNALPVPATQYGNPGTGGVYDHFDDHALNPPVGAAFATIDLLYQPTSWEYIQFLALANDGTHATLGTVGLDLFNAWMATGMAAPHVMSQATWCRTAGTGEDFVMTSQVNGEGDPQQCEKSATIGDFLSYTVSTPDGGLAGAPTFVMMEVFEPHLDPGAFPGHPAVFVTPGAFNLVPIFAASSNGTTIAGTMPVDFSGFVMRLQAIAFSPLAGNGVYATADAHDMVFY